MISYQETQLKICKTRPVQRVHTNVLNIRPIGGTLMPGNG
jgi:hypothetical protein